MSVVDRDPVDPNRVVVNIEEALAELGWRVPPEHRESALRLLRPQVQGRLKPFLGGMMDSAALAQMKAVVVDEIRARLYYTPGFATQLLERL